jgi:hypothetical protein
MMMDYVKFEADAVEGCPSEARVFLQEPGLPRKVITIFEAASEIAPKSTDFNGRKIDGIALGSSRERDELFLDFEGGRVWLLASWRTNSPILVNCSVRSFVESLALVESMYPFYPSDRDLDMAEGAADSLRVALEGIDIMSTADPDGFWSAFLDDVANGDYAGEATG